MESSTENTFCSNINGEDLDEHFPYAIDVDSLVLKVQVDQNLKEWMGCQVSAAHRYPDIRKDQLLAGQCIVSTFPVILTIQKCKKIPLIQALQRQNVVISPSSQQSLLSAHALPLTTTTLLRCLRNIRANVCTLIVHGLKDIQFQAVGRLSIVASEPLNRIDLGMHYTEGGEDLQLYSAVQYTDKLYKLFHRQKGSLQMKINGRKTKAYPTTVHVIKKAGGHINRRIFKFSNKQMRNGMSSLSQVVKFLCGQTHFQPKMRFQTTYTNHDSIHRMTGAAMLQRGITALKKDFLQFKSRRYSAELISVKQYQQMAKTHYTAFNSAFTGMNQKQSTLSAKRHYATLLATFGFSDYTLKPFLPQAYSVAFDVIMQDKDQQIIDQSPLPIGNLSPPPQTLRFEEVIENIPKIKAIHKNNSSTKSRSLRKQKREAMARKRQNERESVHDQGDQQSQGEGQEKQRPRPRGRPKKK